MLRKQVVQEGRGGGGFKINGLWLISPGMDNRLTTQVWTGPTGYPVAHPSPTFTYGLTRFACQTAVLKKCRKTNPKQPVYQTGCIHFCQVQGLQDSFRPPPNREPYRFATCRKRHKQPIRGIVGWMLRLAMQQERAKPALAAIFLKNQGGLMCCTKKRAKSRLKPDARICWIGKASGQL